MPSRGVGWRLVFPVRAEGLHRQDKDASQGPQRKVLAPGDLQIPAKLYESGNAWRSHIAIGIKLAIYPQTRRAIYPQTRRALGML